MKIRALALMVLACSWACQKAPDTTTGPSPISLTCIGSNVCNTGPEPGESPTPGGAGTLPPGSTVGVGIFGRAGCETGIEDVAPGNRQLRVGCAYDFTATPRDASGKDIDQSIHGPNASWASTPAGLVTILPQSDNQFNATVLAGPGAGFVAIEVTVKGTVGKQTFEVVR